MYNSINTTFWGKGKEQTEDLVNQFQKIVIIQEKDFHKDPDIFSDERKAEWETLWKSLIPNKEVLTAVYEDIGWDLIMQNPDIYDINYLKVGNVKLVSSKDFAPFEIHTCQVKIISMFIDFYSMLKQTCYQTGWCSVNIQKTGFHSTIKTNINFAHDVVQMPESMYTDGEDRSDEIWMLNNPKMHSEGIAIPLPVAAIQETLQGLNVHSVGFLATAPTDWRDTETEKAKKKMDLENDIIELADELYPSDETKTLINELFSKYNLDTKH